MAPVRNFNFDLTSMAGAFAGTSQKNRKINTKTLCDIIGSRYYEHNEEINMSEDKIVRCFDENDTVIGDLTLREAL